LATGTGRSGSLGGRRRTLQMGLTISMLPRLSEKKPINRRVQAQNSYVSAVI
jgi:hypothetical protein